MIRLERSFTFVVLCVLVFLAGFPFAAGSECVEFDGLVQPGIPIAVDTGTGAWLEVQTRLDRVYEVEIETDRDVIVEMWELWFDEGDQCYRLEGEISSRTVAAPGATFQWTDPLPPVESMWLGPADGGAPAAVSLIFEEIAAPPTEEVVVVPAVARVHGAGGEFFQSDVAIFNTSAVQRSVELVLVQGAIEGKRRVATTIGPHEMLDLPDVVGTTFGLDEAVGALRVECPTPCRLLAVSRTYATGSEGTYGQFIPGLAWHDSASRGLSGPVRRVLYLEKSEAFRSNVGFVEVMGLDASVDLTLRDDVGAILATATIVVNRDSHRQINDIFAFLGVDTIGAANLEIVMGSEARVFVYGSVIDNQSSDPVFLPGLKPDRGIAWPDDAGPVLTVAAAAATHGFHGSLWRTDLRALMPDEPDLLVDVAFRPHDGRPPAMASFAVPASGTLAVDDIVSVLGSHGSGVLELSCSAGAMMATTRTYTVSPDGTYGQAIPANSNFVNLDHGTVLGLRGDENFRSNVGLVNPHSNPIRVALELRSADDELLGTRQEELGSLEAIQINDIFGAFGLPGCAACRLDYRSESDSGSDNIVVYGSVIDNRSGDPVFVPAQVF